MWILLALAFGTCQTDPVDPVATVTPAESRAPSFSARPDSSKFVSAPSRKVPNSYILKTHSAKDAQAVAEWIAAEHKGIINYVYPSFPGLAIRLPNPDSTPHPPDLGKLFEDDRIVRVSEERFLEIAGAHPPADMRLNTQTLTHDYWNLDKIDSRTFTRDNAYRYEETSSRVPVYVIDSGISPHSEFGGRLAPGIDYTDTPSNYGRVDTDGHGTAVASVIGGNTTGVAKTVTLIPVRVYAHRDSTEESDVMAGVDWVIARNTGSAVANISFGDSAGDSDLDDMVRRLVADGVTTVVGAGNWDNNACESSPGRMTRETHVITVSAVNSMGNRSVFNDEDQPAASYGPCVDIWAPGTAVPAVYVPENKIRPLAGTSIAAPHVAAVAWLILAEESSHARPSHIKDVLLSSATEGVLDSAIDGPNKFLYAPRSVAWIHGPSSVTASGNYTWTARAWGGESFTYLWETSTDGGTTWTSAGTANRYTHTFGSNDNYTLSLRLTVTNGFGDQPSRTWEIPVSTGCIDPPCADSPPVPSFTQECGAAYSCVFTSTSTDDRGIRSLAWVIADSTVSDSTSFTHTFDRAGSVSVKLRVTDTGMQTDSVTNSVTVRPDSMPTASYAVTCVGLECILNGSDSYDDHGVVNYTWYVQGDSVASSAQSSVLYTFPRLGQYRVWLRVKDGAGQTVSAPGRTIYVGDPVTTFALSGECESSHWCTFSASGSAAPRGVARYVWHVDGDSIGYVPHPYQSYGIQFDGVGEYRVRLTVVESTSGRTADTTRVLHIASDSSWLADEVPTDAAPMAAFTSSCTGRSCTFDGSGSSDDVGVETYAWSVTSGATSVATGTSSTLAHRFASDGTYAVRLVVTDSASQADTLSRNVAVEDRLPAAAFTVACDSLSCVFDGSTSTDDLGIATYAWTVDGDSVGTVTADTLAYEFDGAGTYSVRLRVSDTAVPAQTADSTLSVTVPRDAPPEAAFAASCTGRACTFDGSGSTDDVGIETYAWSVTAGDSSVATSSSLTLFHRFASDGTYRVRLIVTDSASQADTLSRNVTVEDLPPAAGFTVACDSLSCVFDGSTSTDDLGIAQYAWTVDGTSVGTVTEDTLAYTFDSVGRYGVRLRVSDTAVPAQTSDSTRQVVVGSTQPPPPPPPPARPDLEVGAPTVSDRAPETGARFTLSATVTNSGDGSSAATTLRYFRSEDATISTSDLEEQETDTVAGLAAGGTSAESILVTAPPTSGTYYYGACVDAVPGESDTTDNCSASVRVDVEPPPTYPNLEVGTPSVSDATPETDASFTLSATVSNAGGGSSAATTLRYYLSADATISASDTPRGTDAVVGLGAGGTSAESISVTAPSTAGRYYYGACVDAVPGESDTMDNCSASVRVDVEPPPTYPNLEVGTPSVSDRAPETDASFTLSATVTNAGDGSSAATTLRYYLSADATISASDTPRGTDAVGGLAAGARAPSRSR